MGGASGPRSVMAAPDLDPGVPGYPRVHSVKMGDSVRWGLVRLFSGAAISDSSLSRRGVMARTPPDRGPGAAKTVELPGRTPGVVYAMLLQPKSVSIDVGVVNTDAL
jgi:hypothetical protein